jgi:hypothetical protein
MAPGVLAWSPQRGPITSPKELAAAVRDGEAVLHVTSEHVVRAGRHDPSLVAVIRLDNDVAALLRQLTDVVLEVNDLRTRLLDIVEAAAHSLASR